jgi:hypothetical protein
MRSLFTVGLALILSGIMTIHARAVTLLSEDFNSDPAARGWTSTDPTNVRWDSGGFLRARGTDQDYAARWEYSPTFSQMNGCSFSFEFNIRPTTTCPFTYPLVALIQQGAQNPYSDAPLVAELLWTSYYYQDFLLTDGPHGNTQELYNGIGPYFGLSPTFDTSKWYHNKITYNADTNQVRWDVTERDSGVSFYSSTSGNFAGTTLGPFNQVAIGYQGVPPIYGYWSEIYVDNINLQSLPEPSSLVLLGAGGIGLLGCAWRRQSASCKPSTHEASK